MFAKAYVIDVRNGEAKAVEKDWNLDAYYETIGCDCIDIAVRGIEGHPFNVVLDDEGLLKGGKRFGAYDIAGRPALAGTLILFGVNQYSMDLEGITEAEAALIERNMAWLIDLSELADYPCVIID